MNMNNIDLSIIIPVYNEEDIIENTVIEVECALKTLDYAYDTNSLVFTYIVLNY